MKGDGVAYVRILYSYSLDQSLLHKLRKGIYIYTRVSELDEIEYNVYQVYYTYVYKKG